MVSPINSKFSEKLKKLLKVRNTVDALRFLVHCYSARDLASGRKLFILLVFLCFMSTKYDIIGKSKVKLSGIFDVKELYIHLHTWLADEHNYDVVEQKYDEKTRSGGKKYLIDWKAMREIDEYSQFIIQANWDLRRVKDITVERGGEKVKMQQGKLKILVQAQLETDYESRWEKKPFFNFLKGFYEKYVYKDTIERLRGQLWNEAWDFVNEVKSFLNLYKYTVEATPGAG